MFIQVLRGFVSPELAKPQLLRDGRKKGEERKRTEREGKKKERERERGQSVGEREKDKWGI